VDETRNADRNPLDTAMMQAAEQRRQSRFATFRNFSRRYPIGMIGAAVLLAITIVALAADYIAPYSAGNQNAPSFVSPNRDYLFGTDKFGQDVFSRVVLGSRVSLEVGLICVPIGLIIGGSLGIIAGAAGGRTDDVIMRFMDILFAFPSLVLAILVAAVLGPSLTNAMIAIGIVIIPIFARTARAPVLSVMQKEFIVASRVAGIRPARLVLRHVVPNSLTPLVVQASISFSAAILDEAALSFLGLGAQPPTPSWGKMLGDARNYITLAPWMALFPGLAIMIAVLAINLLGDGLRDYLDPRMRTRSVKRST
jgi:peptide/nickel transport system permease protein